jgi:spermidine/putrescine transport system permease protein
VTAPAVAQAAGRGARRPAARQRVDRWAGLVEGYFRFHAALTYAFLFLPIIVVVVLAFNARPRRPSWEGFSLRWFSIALATRSSATPSPTASWIAVPNAILATPSAPWPRSGSQRVGTRIASRVRRADLHEHHRPEIVIALATLVLFATSSCDLPVDVRGSSSSSAATDDHRPPTSVSIRASSAARPGAACRGWTDAGRSSADLFATRGGPSARSPGHSCCGDLSPGFLLSFTFSFDDFVITTFVRGPGSRRSR